MVPSPKHLSGARQPIDTFLRILAVLLLVGANAFYVAGEFGLVAASRTRIARLAEEGDEGARRVRRALSRLSFHLSGAQFGITVSSLVLGFIAEPAIADVIDPLLGQPVGPRGRIAIALALAIVFQMVFGELVPKNVAIARPVRTALRVGPPMAAANLAVAPLIRLLNAGANRTVRLLGIQPREELAAVRSLHELELMIEASAEEGDLDPAEAELLARSIDFGRKLAAEVMTPRPLMESVATDSTVAELAERAGATGRSRFPVLGGDGDHVEGIAHVKDVFGIPPEARPDTPVTAILRPATVVPESQPLDVLLRTLRAANAQMAVVVDEHGGTAGVVTLEDLVEEIVGQIADEYDDERPVPPVTAEAGVLPGSAHRFEVEEATGLLLPEGRYETLAGFLLAHLGRIPRPGSRVQWEGWTFEVVSVDGYRIDEVRVIPPRSEVGG